MRLVYSGVTPNSLRNLHITALLMQHLVSSRLRRLVAVDAQVTRYAIICQHRKLSECTKQIENHLKPELRIRPTAQRLNATLVLDCHCARTLKKNMWLLHMLGDYLVHAHPSKTGERLSARPDQREMRLWFHMPSSAWFRFVSFSHL